MKTNVLVFTCIIACIISMGCGKDDPIDPVIDEAYFKAFSIKNPHTEIFFDTAGNYLYVMTVDGGQMIKYDYDQFKVVSIGTKRGTLQDYAFGLGTYLGEPEIYIGKGSAIEIYDGNTLKLKDSMQVYPLQDNRYISSIESGGQNLLFIGVCNSDASGSVVLNRHTKSILTQSHYSYDCFRLRSYHEASTGRVGLIGVAYAPNFSVILSDKFSTTGELLESNYDSFVQGNISKGIVRTHDEADYFISGDAGTLFSKDSIKVLGSLGGLYLDVMIAAHGDTIYGLSTGRAIETFTYPGLQKVNIRELDHNPTMAFLDKGKMIIVYFRTSEEFGKEDIYISKLDL